MYSVYFLQLQERELINYYDCCYGLYLLLGDGFYDKLTRRRYDDFLKLLFIENIYNKKTNIDNGACELLSPNVGILYYKIMQPNNDYG